MSDKRYRARYFQPGSKIAHAGAILIAQDRANAVAMASRLYGRDSAGVERMDVDCTFCEDAPVYNAARWTSADAPEYAACPRCGR